MLIVFLSTFIISAILVAGIPGLTLEKMQVFTVLIIILLMQLCLERNRMNMIKIFEDAEKLINSIKIDRNVMENVQQNQSKPTLKN